MGALGAARWVAVETAGARCYADFRFRADDALLFGPETRGLPRKCGSASARQLRSFIPMRPGSRSLNLSNAVAVVAYEAWRQLASVPEGAAAASLRLRANLPSHERMQRGAHRSALVHDAIHLEADGHFDAARSATLRTAEAAVTPSTT